MTCRGVISLWRRLTKGLGDCRDDKHAPREVVLLCLVEKPFVFRSVGKAGQTSCLVVVYICMWPE